MSDHVTIKSADGATTLELFAPRGRGTFSARLRGLEFNGTVEVYDDESPPDLGAFFRDIADHWRGWSGEKCWESLEGQLSLKAKSDSTGHTHLVVRLRGGPTYDWHIGGPLLIEAGQLEMIATDVERFVRLTHAA